MKQSGDLCLSSDIGPPPDEKRKWRDGIFKTVEGLMQRQGGLSVKTMCELAGVARSSFYRYLRNRTAERNIRRIGT